MSITKMVIFWSFCGWVSHSCIIPEHHKIKLVINEHHETRYVIYFHLQRKNGVHEQHKTPKTAYCCFSATIPVVDTGQGRDEDDDKDDYGDDDDYGEDKDDDKDDEDEEDYGL